MIEKTKYTNLVLITELCNTRSHNRKPEKHQLIKKTTNLLFWQMAKVMIVENLTKVTYNLTLDNPPSRKETRSRSIRSSLIEAGNAKKLPR
jgi:hypothetical protein